MNNIIITTDCVADLPGRVYQERGIEVIYFDIQTESGLFRDTEEIDSQNVLDYMINGEKNALSRIPTANEYKAFFDRILKDFDEIIHICISSKVSLAYENAMLARAKMGRDGDKIHIVDSNHLSSGQGLIALEAANCVEEGMESKAIISHLEAYIPKVSTSFLCYNLDYLYYNKKIGKTIKDLCGWLKLHPVLKMEDGKLSVCKAYFGNYDNARKNYIKDIVGNTETVDKTNGFITYVGCNEEMLESVRAELGDLISFETLTEKEASATVSCNCGPKTFGIIFAKKE